MVIQRVKHILTILDPSEFWSKCLDGIASPFRHGESRRNHVLNNGILIDLQSTAFTRYGSENILQTFRRIGGKIEMWILNHRSTIGHTLRIRIIGRSEVHVSTDIVSLSAEHTHREHFGIEVMIRAIYHSAML